MPPIVVDLPTLRSPRLVLTPLTGRHLRQFASIAGQHAIADTTISVPHPLTEESAREWIARAVSESRSGLAAHYCIAIGPASGEMIGYAGLKSIDQDHGKGEISFWLHPDEWTKGYMTEAAECLLEFGFHFLQLNRICAYHMVRNPASARVLAKLGSQQEGRLRERVRKWGVYEDGPGLVNIGKRPSQRFQFLIAEPDNPCCSMGQVGRVKGHVQVNCLDAQNTRLRLQNVLYRTVAQPPIESETSKLIQGRCPCAENLENAKAPSGQRKKAPNFPNSKREGVALAPSQKLSVG